MVFFLGGVALALAQQKNPQNVGDVPSVKQAKKDRWHLVEQNKLYPPGSYRIPK